MTEQINQNLSNFKTSKNGRASSKAITRHINRILSVLQRGTSRIFDLGGGLAALFTIMDMCFVWYGAFYGGGAIVVGDTLLMLQLELVIIGPLALVWILAKFRG
ncbi:MAG: hypothetical protein ACFFCF_07235 [Promethearchaeota archaeon]